MNKNWYWFVVPIFFSLSAFGCSKECNYGLLYDGMCYSNSYLVSNASLVIKNYSDFESQFETAKYKQFEKRVEKADTYLQAEPLYFPVVQDLKDGVGVVFIFELTLQEDDYIVLRRLAVECDSISPSMSIPEVCHGYFLEDGADWPPEFIDIVSGRIELSQMDLIAGYYVGTVHLVLDGGGVISGPFSVYDKRKHLFLLSPVR